MLLRQDIDSPLEILLVEDNPGEAQLAIQALEASAVPNNLRVLRNGIDALSYLRRSAKSGAARSPDLIILDLNHPRISGPAVLAEIRQDADLKDIPTILVTTTDSGPELFQACGLKAGGHAVGLVDLERYMRIVQTIAMWFAFSKPPLDAPWPRSSSGDRRIY